MKNISSLRIVGFPIFLGSLLAFPAFGQSIHTYKIDWFPADHTNCPSEAVGIAKNFSESTGLVVVSAECEQPFSWKQDVVIRYQAEIAPRLISTYDENAQNQGTYSDRKACEQNLAFEKSLFHAKTELEVVTAFCFPETSLSGDNLFPFVARIDGFGRAKLRPFVFDAHIYTSPEQSSSQLEEIISSSLAQFSWAESPRVRVDTAGSLPRVVIKYYSSRARGFSLDTVASFENVDACNRKKAGIDAILGKFGILGTRSFCSRDRFSETAPYYYFGVPTNPYFIERAPYAFADRAQCESVLPRLVSSYGASTGSAMVEGLCSYERAEIWTGFAFFAKVLIGQ